jgi:hypothetical protein
MLAYSGDIAIGRYLRPSHVWSIRTKLQMQGRQRDLALFNLAIDSKLRGCDVVAIRVDDVAPSGYAMDRATIRSSENGHAGCHAWPPRGCPVLDEATVAHQELQGDVGAVRRHHACNGCSDPKVALRRQTRCANSRYPWWS